MAQLNAWARLFLDGLVRQRLATIILQSGWLPHYSLPDDLYEVSRRNLDDWDDVTDEDLARISDTILDFYREHWAEIRPIIQANIEQYAPDQESIDAEVEALDAHEQGLYRCVCSVLFPTI